MCGRQRRGRGVSGLGPHHIFFLGAAFLFRVLAERVSVMVRTAFDGVSFSFLFGAIARAVGLGRNRGRSCTLFSLLGRLGVLDWGWGRWV